LRQNQLEARYRVLVRHQVGDAVWRGLVVLEDPVTVAVLPAWVRSPDRLESQ
jgi:hypothetical protein